MPLTLTILLGGMGMNSGIHDAHSLAPKLAKVLEGESETLLDQYSDERRTYAVEKRAIIF